MKFGLNLKLISNISKCCWRLASNLNQTVKQPHYNRTEIRKLRHKFRKETVSVQLFTFLRNRLSVSLRIPLLKSLTCEGEFSVISVLRVNAPDGLELESVSHSAAAEHGVYGSLCGRMRSVGLCLFLARSHYYCQLTIQRTQKCFLAALFSFVERQIKHTGI